MRRSTHDFRRRLSSGMLEMANIVRRIVFGGSTGGRWSVLGYETADGTEGDGDDPIDVFQGLYIYARPGSSDNAEGLMLTVGSKTNNQAVAAVRNEDARARYVEEFGDIAAGEVAIFNSDGDARVHISADGDITIEAQSEVNVRTPGGTAVELALKSDVQAIFDTMASVVIAPTDGGAAIKTAFGAVSGIPAGTTVLKGE